MTEYHWHTALENAIDDLGDKPWPDTERQIREHFTDDPERVIEAIAELAGEIAKGNAPRSPWAVLRKRLNEQPPPDVIVTVDEKARAIRRAETLIRNIGRYYTEDELYDELFGPRGHLEPYADDHKLADRMRHAWQKRTA